MQYVAQKHQARSQRAAVNDDTVELTLAGKDFLLAQCSIVTSVVTEPNTHLIHPATAKFINANGDGWTNESLLANYKSFIGAYNFLNHVQEDSQAVGFLADVGLRRIVLDAPANLFVYYADILVATHKDANPALTKNLLLNKVEYMSMGCETFYATCSCCGRVVRDEIDMCDHLLNQKGRYFIDDRGVKRITAELLGNKQPGSCQFIEASWLSEPPAFGGAIKRNFLPVGDDHAIIVRMPTAAAQRPAVRKFID